MHTTNYQTLYEQYNDLVKHTSWQEAGELLQNNQLAKLIDVRELAEWQAGHIAGAIHVARSNLSTISQYVPDKDTPLLVYCARGVRSVVASHELAQAGYTNVQSIDGGIIAADGEEMVT